MDLLTFGLAYAAYLLLGADVVLHTRGTPKRALTLLLVVVLVAHVGLVWGHRFGGSLSVALEKSLAGFVIFHAAFLAIVGSVFAPEPWRGRLLYAAFPVVTLGALGAAFRYDYVEVYRIPLIAALAATLLLVAIVRRRSG